MSYLRDNLVKALGGKVILENKNNVIKNWTPNNIRALFLSRDFIVVVPHVGVNVSTKIISLDVAEVAKELDVLSRTYYGKPKLNTLLNRRTLSCLEEIYVDSMFMNYPMVLDIVGYVKELLSSNSRLRFFGYGEFPLGSDVMIKNKYLENNGKVGYTFALDTSRGVKLEYRDTENKDWYKNYYLRPQFYSLDAEKGKLSMHMKKFQNMYANYLNNISSNIEDEAITKSISAIVENDLKNKELLDRFSKLVQISFKHKNDDVCSRVYKSIQKVISELKPIKGLNNKYLSQVPEDFRKNYENFGLVDKNKDNEIDKGMLTSKLKSGKGFINIDEILDNVCLEVTYRLYNNYKDMVSLSLVMCGNLIPDGNFRGKYYKSSANGSVYGYFDYLGDIIGWEI